MSTERCGILNSHSRNLSNYDKRSLYMNLYNHFFRQSFKNFTINPYLCELLLNFLSNSYWKMVVTHLISYLITLRHIFFIINPHFSININHFYIHKSSPTTVNQRPIYDYDIIKLYHVWFTTDKFHWNHDITLISMYSYLVVGKLVEFSAGWNWIEWKICHGVFNTESYRLTDYTTLLDDDDDISDGDL